MVGRFLSLIIKFIKKQPMEMVLKFIKFVVYTDIAFYEKKYCILHMRVFFFVFFFYLVFNSVDSLCILSCMTNTCTCIVKLERGCIVSLSDSFYLVAFLPIF